MNTTRACVIVFRSNGRRDDGSATNLHARTLSYDVIIFVIAEVPTTTSTGLSPSPPPPALNFLSYPPSRFFLYESLNTRIPWNKNEIVRLMIRPNCIMVK